MYYLYGVLGVLVVLIIVLVIRTLMFKLDFKNEAIQDIKIDEKKVLARFVKKIKYPTISYDDSSKINQQAFKDFKAHLRNDYPEINKVAEYQEIGTGVLFRIKGESSDNPIVLMSHFDVVPVSNNWTKDPFGAEMDETYVYGRGTLDTKLTINAAMESVEYLLTQGKIFKQDIYLSFGGDEEIGGKSQIAITSYFKEKHIRPYLVLDEGGAIVSNMFPGVKEKVAAVGIAEKGFLNLELKAGSKGGHASTPPKETAVTVLADAVNKLNRSKLFKMKMTYPVRAMFDHITPHSKNFIIRMIFANMWLFKPLVNVIAKLSGGQLKAMFKTTLAFTISEGSKAYNVLPNEAKIGINIRLRPDEPSEVIINRIKKIINNDDITVTPILVSEPSPVSFMDEGYDAVEKAINETFQNTIVAPYLMVATTDSRYYHEISDRVYKFSPMDVSSDDLSRMHADDERMSNENVINSVKFYIRLLNRF